MRNLLKSIKGWFVEVGLNPMWMLLLIIVLVWVLSKVALVAIQEFKKVN